MAYIGTQPKDIRSFGKAKFDFTATQGQTSFFGLDDDGKTFHFTAGQITVYLNGILLDESDYWFYDGTELNLNSPANAGDILSVVALQTDIPNSDYVPATGGTFSGAVVANDGLTVNNDAATVLTVDRATSEGTLVGFKKDGSTVGSVGVQSGGLFVGHDDVGLLFYTGGQDRIIPRSSTTYLDGVLDVGDAGSRFKDLYLSGGVYLGGTGAANLLDDYEEGTWSPYWANVAGNPIFNTGPYVNMARYTKVGNTVTASCYFNMPPSFSSNANYASGSTLHIGGLPFTASGNGSADYYAGSCGWYNGLNGWTAGYTPMIYTESQTTVATLVYARTTDVLALSQFMAYSSNSGMIVTLTYKTAS